MIIKCLTERVFGELAMGTSNVSQSRAVYDAIRFVLLDEPSLVAVVALGPCPGPMKELASDRFQIRMRFLQYMLAHRKATCADCAQQYGNGNCGEHEPERADLHEMFKKLAAASPTRLLEAMLECRTQLPDAIEEPQDQRASDPNCKGWSDGQLLAASQFLLDHPELGTSVDLKLSQPLVFHSHETRIAYCECRILRLEALARSRNLVMSELEELHERWAMADASKARIEERLEASSADSSAGHLSPLLA